MFVLNIWPVWLNFVTSKSTNQKCLAIWGRCLRLQTILPVTSWSGHYNSGCWISGSLGPWQDKPELMHDLSLILESVFLLVPKTATIPILGKICSIVSVWWYCWLTVNVLVLPPFLLAKIHMFVAEHAPVLLPNSLLFHC